MQHIYPLEAKQPRLMAGHGSATQPPRRSGHLLGGRLIERTMPMHHLTARTPNWCKKTTALIFSLVENRIRSFFEPSAQRALMG